MLSYIAGMPIVARKKKGKEKVLYCTLYNTFLFTVTLLLSK